MKKITDNIPLTIVMILISAASSFAVVQAKVSDIEKKIEKGEATITELRDFRAEQRVVTKDLDKEIDELKGDIKLILRAVKK